MDTNDYPTTERELLEARERNWEAQLRQGREAQEQITAEMTQAAAVFDEHAGERFTGASPQRIAVVTVGLDRRLRDVGFLHQEPLRRFDRETVAEELTAAFREAQRLADERRLRLIAEAAAS
jgi:hypothetical protein